MQIRILKQAFTAAAFITLLISFSTAPAQAQTSRLYFASYLGLNNFPEQAFRDSGSGTGGDLEFNNSFSFAGALGLRLSKKVRLEAELSYSNDKPSAIKLANGSQGGLGGEVRSYTTMLNVYYDFDKFFSSAKIQPYLGAGLGLGWYEGNIADAAGLASNTSGDATALTWQIGGGFKYRIDPGLAFTTSYRYVDGMDIKFGTYEIDNRSHQFRLGLEYDLPIK